MPQRAPDQPELRCYRCGASLAALSLPLARLDQCPSCSVDLHVCRMCLHYAPTLPEACDEEDAIEVANKTGANFCDYFRPDAGAFDGRERHADLKARHQLDALFGDRGAADAGGSDAARSDAGATAADAALEAAEKLFRK